MKIVHNPIFNTKNIEEHYTAQDGVPVYYVCTSELPKTSVVMDIFYRETPHPEFGNRYFGLYYDTVKDSLMITNADSIEGSEFAMIEVDNEWHYSSHRHDFKQFQVGEDCNKIIDGGRAYARGVGYEFFTVKDGKIVTNN